MKEVSIIVPVERVSPRPQLHIPAQSKGHMTHVHESRPISIGTIFAWVRVAVARHQYHRASRKCFHKNTTKIQPFVRETIDCDMCCDLSVKAIVNSILHRLLDMGHVTVRAAHTPIHQTNQLCTFSRIVNISNSTFCTVLLQGDVGVWAFDTVLQVSNCLCYALLEMHFVALPLPSLSIVLFSVSLYLSLSGPDLHHISHLSLLIFE